MSNVRVCAKIRPQNEREDREGSHICVSNTTTDVILDASKKEKFNFDHVFGPETNQEDVFERVGLPLVDTVLSGINCTLFAYGQSEFTYHHASMRGSTALSRLVVAAPNAQHLTPHTQHPTPNTQLSTPNTQHPTTTQHPTLNPELSTLNSQAVVVKPSRWREQHTLAIWRASSPV